MSVRLLEQWNARGPRSLLIPPEGQSLEAVEIALLQHTLDLASGNKTRPS